MDGGAHVTRDLVERIGWAAFNPTKPTYHNLVREYAFNDKNKIDFDWIEANIDYINDLSEDDRKLVTFYTKYGDEFLNSFMRKSLSSQKIESILSKATNTASKQFLKNHLAILHARINHPSNIKHTMKPYMTILNRVILGAPPLQREIKVFRGVKDMKWLSNGTHTEPGCMSSTIFLPATLQFMEDEFTTNPTKILCCLLEIRVRVGTPCAFIAPASKKRGEYEVLFPPGTVLKVLSKSEKYLVDEINPDHKEVERIIIETHLYPESGIPFRKYTVYEAVI